MPYCTTKTMSQTRGKAMRMLILERQSIQKVADEYGVHRTTIWRWKQKWLEQNRHVNLHNAVRHKDVPTSKFRLDSCTWNIPTKPAIPLHPHCLSDDLVQLVLDVRDQLRRCAEVVWHYVNCILGISISLSSVCRILKRHGRYAKRRKKRQKYKGLKRPDIQKAGDLVEIDTIHLYNPISKTKRYIYTIIDVYSRMTYAKAYDELRPGLAVKTILEAEQYIGVRFTMVQSDNGAEFSSYFEERLSHHGISIRHTRLGRPNDNAHIERFNRTLQEECTGSYFVRSVSLVNLNSQIGKYLDYYNYKRIHLGISYRIPSEMLQRL